MDKAYLLQLAKHDLGQARDNLHRARAAFRGQDMSQQHGESGRTRGEILSGYEEWENKAKSVVASLEEPSPSAPKGGEP